MHAFRFSTAALALAALFVGCDAADPSVGAGADAVTAEDAAVLVADALALDAGGALDVAADAANASATAAGFVAGDPNDPACTVQRTYDPAAQTWTRMVACERGNPDGAFYARYGRTQTAQFLDASGNPQEDPHTAVALDLVLVDGYGTRRTPVLAHELLDIGGTFEVTRLNEDLVTINGTYTRAATDTLRTRRAERTLTYDLALTFDDVRGPRGVRQHWDRAVSGSVSGTVSGTATAERRNGQTRTRAFERAFTVTFGEEGGEGVATIRVDGETFRADPTTGEVVGVE